MNSGALTSSRTIPKIPAARPFDSLASGRAPSARSTRERVPGLAYGCGRSYGDSCLAVSDEVLVMSGLSRIVSADWNNGIIVAEAGLTIAELIRVAGPFLEDGSPP